MNTVFRPLINPLMIAVTADEDERKRVGLGHITLEKNGFVVSTICAIRLIRSSQSGIIRNGRWDGMQYVSHFLLSFIPINERLIWRGFRVAT